MMRLQRVGRKNNPSYRVLVVDSRQGVGSGKFIDQLGSYNPKAGVYEIDAEKAKHWLSKGVQPSPTVHNMLVSKKIVSGEKITVQKPKKAQSSEGTESSKGAQSAEGGEAPKKEEVAPSEAQSSATEASTEAAA